MGAPVCILILSAFIAVSSEAVVAEDAVNSQITLLTELMRLQSNVTSVNWSLEETVGLLKNVFTKRILCETQSGIDPKICDDCLSGKRIVSITSGNDSSLPNRTIRKGSTTINDLSRLTVVFLNYLLTFQTSCTPESLRQGYVGSCRVYKECWDGVQKYFAQKTDKILADNIENIEQILREVKAVYEPDPSKNCFSAEIIIKELDTRADKFVRLPRDISTVLIITSHLFSGECIDVGESVADFLDDIFLHYGDSCERIITQSGFNKLWNDLQMQRHGKHTDHGVQKTSCEFSRNNPQILRPAKVSAHDRKLKRLEIAEINTTTPPNGNSLSTTEPNNSAPLLQKDYPISSNSSTNDYRNNFENNDSEVTSENTSEKPNFTNSYDTKAPFPSNDRKTLQDPVVFSSAPENNQTYENTEVPSTESNRTATEKRVKRHTRIIEEHEHKNLANECLPSDDLLRRFLTPGNKVITSLEFLQLCPALVQQAVSGVCNKRLMKGSTAIDSAGVSSINVTSVTIETSKSKNSWNAAAAVSVITGASLLGLIFLPVLKKPYFIFINAFFIGLAFGTMSGDVVLHIMPQYLGLHKHDDDHGHQEDESVMERYFPVHMQRQLLFLLTMYILFIVESIFSTLSGDNQEHHGHSHGPIEVEMKSFDEETCNSDERPKLSCFAKTIRVFKNPSSLLKGVTSKIIVILLADTVHNFADGMAIAVGYSLSNKDGFSTTIAVFFHELPHEVGDFALLMTYGLEYWQALIFNLLSGLSAFIGLGIGVFTASAFREWLLCITAGLFFFVVMGEMLPDMRLRSKDKWGEFAVKIIGTVLGIITMVCIAVYEKMGAL